MNWQKIKDKLLFGVQFLLYTMIKYWRFWLLLIALLILAWWLRGCRDDRIADKSESLHVEHNTQIDITAEEVRSAFTVAKLEFLTIETEELAEMSKTGLWGTSHLARIYPGKIRLGIDMSQLKPDWITVAKDTAKLQLPYPSLLEENFIDEASSRPFHEKGSWTPAEREMLYQKAHTAMLKRSLTPERKREARKAATSHFSRALFALGFKFVIIKYY